MRAFYVAVALIAVVAGADGIRANVVGTGPSGIKSFATDPAIPRNIGLRSRGVGRAAKPREPAAGFDNPLSLPKRRGNATNLAQTATPVDQTLPPQQMSGDPSVAPYKWAGFLNNPMPSQGLPNGNGCTAQFITTNVILTAAHCLQDLPVNPSGPWPDPSKMAFRLQFQNGQWSQSFNIVCGATNPLWKVPSNYNSMTAAQQAAALTTAYTHDFAMLLVNGTSPTGYMSYVLDWKGKYTYAARIGYADDILNAKIIQEAPGIVFFADAIPLGSLSSPNLVVQWGYVTNATEGTSGGAWIANLNSTEGAGNNILIAVSSFITYLPAPNNNLPLYPGGTWAAYLTAAEFNPLLQKVQNGCK
jgi:hypothetical protein